jgi:CheY-like chemotaxis protein
MLNLHNICQKLNPVMEEIRKIKILYAEDNDSNYILAKAMLKGVYDIFRAINGAEAIQLYSSIEPDIILMDMKMPVMDGLEATRKLRQMGVTVPIIALTAFAYDNDRSVALQAGCTEYITKPYRAETLRKTITKLLNLD